MKTAKDPRHKKRQRIIQELFSNDFNKQPVGISTQEVLNHFNPYKNYNILNSKDKIGRISLVNILYNSNKLKFKKEFIPHLY